jgi:hypothetical protein
LSGQFILVSAIGPGGVASVSGVNVTGSTAPANGIYLPSANTVGIAANTTELAIFSTSGVALAPGTNSAQGAGTLNASGLYVSGNSVLAPFNATATSAQTFTGTTLTTYSVSPSLASGGIYLVQIGILLYATLAGGGYKLNMSMTASTSTWAPLTGLQTVAGASPAACLAINGGTNISAATVSTSSTAPDLVTASTVFKTSRTGSFSIQIAQNSATGTLSAGIGSYVLVTRLA